MNVVCCSNGFKAFKRVDFIWKIFFIKGVLVEIENLFKKMLLLKINWHKMGYLYALIHTKKENQ